MKKILLPIAFVLCVMGLKSQENSNTTTQRKQVGQFAWKRTAQDSVDVRQLPFMRDMLFVIPDVNYPYKAMLRGATYMLFPENKNK
jgi:hypothetical protein